MERQLNDAQKKAQDTDTAASQPVAHNIEVIPRILGIVEWDLQRLKVLLQWIENERQAMDSGHPAPVEEGSDDHNTAPKAVRRISTCARNQKGRLETSAVLGKARVSKATTKKRNTQTRKSRALGRELTVQGPHAIPESSLPQTPARQEMKPQRIKEKLLRRQLRPQRVSKAKRFTGARAESLSVTRPQSARQTQSTERARPKRRPAPQRPQPTPGIVVMRSGRVSRPPVR